MTIALICADPHHPLIRALADRFHIQPRHSQDPLRPGDRHRLVVQTPTAIPFSIQPVSVPTLEVWPEHLDGPALLPGCGRLRHSMLTSELSQHADKLTLERLLLWPYGPRSPAWLHDQDLLDTVESWLSDPWQGERWVEGPESFSADETATAIAESLETALSSSLAFSRLKFEVCDQDGDRQLNPNELRATLLRAGVSAGEVGLVLETLGAPEGITAAAFHQGLDHALADAIAHEQCSVQMLELTRQTAETELLLHGWHPHHIAAIHASAQPRHQGETRGMTLNKGIRTLKNWLRTAVISWIAIEIVPGLGVLSRRERRSDGEPSLLFTYRLADGRVALVQRSADFRHVDLRWHNSPEPEEEIVWEEGELRRSLAFVNRRIAAVRVEGHWSELNRVEKLFISGEQLSRWMLELFRRRGCFQLEQEQPHSPADFICRCAHVSCKHVASLILETPDASITDIANQTRATTICGGCVPVLETWLAVGGAMPPGAATTPAPFPTSAKAQRKSVAAVVAAGASLMPIQNRLDEARAFLHQCYEEQHLEEVLTPRLKEVEQQLQRDGAYVHSYDELAYGGKLAWRNSTRCLGRQFWRELHVRDRRDLNSEQQMFQAILDHIEAATNGGQLRSTLTVFQPDGRRIWNPQFCRYAGYRLADGSVLGDPMQLELTEALLNLGWTPGERSAFDLLPIVIQIPGREPCWFELPEDLILEIEISHPEFEWFADLGLRWYALPAVSNMALDCGGVQYSAAPFSGFYMGTEIGARNLGDQNRYNQLPLIASAMGLDTRSDRSLWRDRTLVELNVAVLHSYEQAGVRMADHHSLTQSFMEFAAAERQCGRGVQVDARSVVPPISASATPTFHAEFDGDQIFKPNFFFQHDPWTTNTARNEEAFSSHDVRSCPFRHGSSR